MINEELTGVGKAITLNSKNFYKVMRKGLVLMRKAFENQPRLVLETGQRVPTKVNKYMSDDTHPTNYYNREERRKMKKQGKLVRFDPVDGKQFICEHLESEWCSECIWPGRQMAREIALPKDHPDKGRINL